MVEDNAKAERVRALLAAVKQLAAEYYQLTGSVESLAREFEPCAVTIAGWIRQAGTTGPRTGYTAPEPPNLKPRWTRPSVPEPRQLFQIT